MDTKPWPLNHAGSFLE